MKSDNKDCLTLDTIRDIKIYQQKNGYRFSMDAVLLYSFVNMPLIETIADLGAGSGIVGMLLAKKYTNAKILLFELQVGLTALAEKNVRLNNLQDRVKVINSDLREIKTLYPSTSADYPFDVVVSNPPFRKDKSGLISDGEERAIARHEIKLKLPELISASQYLLKSKGRLYLVYHPARLAELVRVLKEKGMETKRLRFVHSNTRSEAKMVLVEAAKDGRTGLKVEHPLYVYDGSGGYTEEVKDMYSCD